MTPVWVHMHMQTSQIAFIHRRDISDMPIVREILYATICKHLHECSPMDVCLYVYVMSVLALLKVWAELGTPSTTRTPHGCSPHRHTYSSPPAHNTRSLFDIIKPNLSGYYCFFSLLTWLSLQLPVNTDFRVKRTCYYFVDYSSIIPCPT
ncbi:hypothetical protein BCR43DRAFT_143449 [Syncephalastrum racemosum]|uniref:Uncharacterized protein n=1 Tax=Syncephalastrum racemosum TaxID=13706 RepID=A0A1X2HMA8_SYNRA|nr:hypothetical protein BCR43DRAFT_143449 [Syncephalastrum racemosum]